VSRTVARVVQCELFDGAADIGALPDLDPTEKREPWLSPWLFERSGKRWQVAVRATVVCPPVLPPDWTGADHDVTTVVDARTWIETLGDRARWPEGTVFDVVVTEVAAEGEGATP